MKKIVLLFPGQNLQNFKDIIYFNQKTKILNKTFEESSEILNLNLLKILKKRNFIKKKYISYLIINISIALYREWKKNIPIIPNIMIGHSLGQYSALICSKKISLKNALLSLKKRNRILKNSFKNIPTLMYIIIGIHFSIIKKICYIVSRIFQKVSIACINLKNQIIISGHKKYVLKVLNFCKKIQKNYIIRLPIYFCLHYSFLKKNSKKFSKYLKKNIFKNSHIKVFCATQKKFLYSSQKIKNSLCQQLYKPTLWYDTLKIIKKKNIKNFIEIGAGNTLTKINFHNKIFNTYSTNTLKNFLKTLKIIKNQKL
ncbi:hypothetical protein [Buchnera aphidicola]|uniref:hypothetical protein n=1 Tax=Buchnera aphidicola TaxID=9 RepID=UPI0031B70C6A